LALVRKGVLYPDFTGIGARSSHFHKYFFDYFQPATWGNGSPVFSRPLRDGQVHAFLRELETFEGDVILSAEYLANYAPKNIERLRHVFGAYDNIRIIAYLRRQDERVRSAYSERAKLGAAQTISEVLLEKRPSLRYYDLLDPWAEVFGDENVVVRPFEKAQWEGEDLITDFLWTVGLERSADFGPTFDTNRSLVRDQIEFLYECNRNPGIPFRWATNPMVDYAQRHRDPDPHPYHVLSPRQRHELLADFDPQNRRVSHRFLGGRRLFSEPLPQIGEPWEPYPGLSEDRRRTYMRYCRQYYLRQSIMRLRSGFLGLLRRPSGRRPPGPDEVATGPA
jgi:hypothetical protein